MLEKQNIVNTYIEDEIKNSYIDYSMSVIVGRALPDVRDGLKPVHRRILYAMNELSLSHNKPYKKSARIVGEVLGKYHPHGDTAVYDALVRMTQDFSLRYPLIDGQGNFGSIDGDSPAAMRYTEARMSKISSEILKDIEKETVEFKPNFDETLLEPEVLPSILPNLIINGSNGIAVGMATNIPPHNLNEVCDAITFLLDNSECSIKDLMKFIKGPDFPTGAFICGLEGIKNAYETGRGSLTVQCRAFIETGKQGGKESIIITEIPYQLNKNNLIEKIADLVRDGKIEGISDVRDESDREGMRIVIEIKRGAVAQVVLNKLYKLTELKTTFGVIMLAIVHGQPKILNLKELLVNFIEFRKEVIIKRTKFDLKKAELRAHILEGLKIAIANIDEVIEIIKKAKDYNDAKTKLMSRFELTEIQTDAILEMRLQRLTGLEVQKLETEYLELIQLIEYLKSILENPYMVINLIKEEMKQLKEIYGDARRTEITAESKELSVEDLIADESVIITISHTGYIKRMNINIYRSQGRGGKGKYGMETKEDDFVEHMFVATTHNYILFFTDKGKCYWLKVYDIPEGGRLSKGKAIVNLLPLESGEKIRAFVNVKKFTEEEYLFFTTEKGTVKKCNLMLFSNPRNSGIIAITLPKDDNLIEVKITDGKTDILLGTKHGKAIRFSETVIRSMGRSAYGVRGIRLDKGDRVIGMMPLKPAMTILAVTELGFGKRTDESEYRKTGRGGKGIINIKRTDKNGDTVSILGVNDDDELMIITHNGVIMRQKIKEISSIGRNTQGVRVIRLAQGDKVMDICRVAPEENGNGNGTEIENGTGTKNGTESDNNNEINNGGIDELEKSSPSEENNEM